jgi:hypothetical protein
MHAVTCWFFMTYYVNTNSADAATIGIILNRSQLYCVMLMGSAVWREARVDPAIVDVRMNSTRSG